MCVLVVAIAAAGCSSAPRTPIPSSRPHVSAGSLRVQVGEAGNVVRQVALEDYVRAAIVSELAPPPGDVSVAARILDVQAVIARTYALANAGRHAPEGFDLCSTTHCQLYEPSRLGTSRWAQAAAEAAHRTAGAVVWHDRAPAVALFHADCGGHTSTSVSAWGGTARPYLMAVPDDGPAEGAHGRWSYAVSATDLARALNADGSTHVGSRIDMIRVVDRDASGRAATVALHGSEERLVRGEALRAVLARQFGARAVRSTLFDVRREGRAFRFDGRGFGHGVGLCQAGALARIRAGASAGEVLRHYYPGTTLRASN